jgi:hypothetical protein
VAPRAEILARTREGDLTEIESLLRNAIAFAQRQGAVLPALRSATSLARMLWHRRRRSEAREVLEPYAGLIASLAGNRDAASAAELM